MEREEGKEERGKGKESEGKRRARKKGGRLKGGRRNRGIKGEKAGEKHNKAKCSDLTKLGHGHTDIFSLCLFLCLKVFSFSI